MDFKVPYQAINIFIFGIIFFELISLIINNRKNGEYSDSRFFMALATILPAKLLEAK